MGASNSLVLGSINGVNGATSSTNVGIGTSTPGYTLTVNGQPAANGYTAFTNYSDARLKKNIRTIGSGVLDKIMQLRPVQFNYNEEYLVLYNDTASLSKTYKGFIAQEVREVFPEMVGSTKVKGKEYYDLNTSNLQVYLVKAVQELNQKNADLQQQNEEQKKQMELMLKRIEQLEKR